MMMRRTGVRPVFRFATRNRAAQKHAATELLIDHMNTVVHERGSRLLVALLFANPEFAAHHAARLAARGIAFVDCRIAGPWEPLMVRGEGHPNGVANTRWAECIGDVPDAALVRGAP